MARSVALGCLLLLGLAAVASARSPNWMHSGSNVNAMKWITERLSRRGGKTDEPVYLAIKYVVPPSVHDNFIDEWERLERDIGEEKRCNYYMLSKTQTDNTCFYAYIEWDTVDDMMEHFDSKYVEKFTDFCEDNDILVEMFPLEAVGDTDMESRGRGRRSNADLAKRGRRDRSDVEDPRELPAHVFIKFTVPPSVHKEFEDQWMNTADRTVDEKENRHYALRKVATLNNKYMVCGSWDSIEGYFDHVTSKHFRKLREYTAECDIEWHAEPMRGIASSEEEY